ncbi:hypothetical protein [Nocardioides mesophilus]|uniref:Uncharacterized protein n=1 Tax=Nocardioides mesophilus TaxID=433659 RepID=A0A7G9R9R5_9ACTN|nr:hypothetical protein [Nocardioides mesophilus]QNN52340.1 hypothetical protein H9L09_17925 [Nocardioides mesophilus]
MFFLALAYSLALLPRSATDAFASDWWPLLVVLAVGWQVGMVWLFIRLVSLQSTTPRRRVPGPG